MRHTWGPPSPRLTGSPPMPQHGRPSILTRRITPSQDDESPTRMAHERAQRAHHAESSTIATLDLSTNTPTEKNVRVALRDRSQYLASMPDGLRLSLLLARPAQPPPLFAAPPALRTIPAPPCVALARASATSGTASHMHSPAASRRSLASQRAARPRTARRPQRPGPPCPLSAQYSSTGWKSAGTFHK